MDSVTRICIRVISNQARNPLIIVVLDLVSQVRDAILMNIYLEGRNPGGSGIWNWGVYEQGERIGEFSLQAIGDQGGRILSQQGGFQVSERGSERGARGNSKGRR